MVVWIEILILYTGNKSIKVTTCVVVWIEMFVISVTPSPVLVTTCVVVWIEILKDLRVVVDICVTTCVVVWIEIRIWSVSRWLYRSPPAWWCGLKFLSDFAGL